MTLTLEPDTPLARKLGGLTENRRRLVDERTRQVNQMHSVSKTYYPLAETLLGGHMTTPMAADFLARWPDLAALQKADPKTLRAFFYKHNSRGAEKMEKRLAAAAKARPLTEDEAIIAPARHLATALAAVLKALHHAIAAVDKDIAQTFDQHPDAALFRSLPGAGPALAPRLLVAFGTKRDRFASAAEVAQFYGIAPVVKQSGNTETIHMRSRCPKFGRQTFHENAGCAFKKEPWAKCYYDNQKGKPDGKHHKACRAVAYKLIRIYYACWKHNSPYDGQRHLQALEKHGSPLHAQLQTLSPKKVNNSQKIIDGITQNSPSETQSRPQLAWPGDVDTTGAEPSLSCHFLTRLEANSPLSAGGFSRFCFMGKRHETTHRPWLTIERV